MSSSCAMLAPDTCEVIDLEEQQRALDCLPGMRHSWASKHEHASAHSWQEYRREQLVGPRGGKLQRWRSWYETVTTPASDTFSHGYQLPARGGKTFTCEHCHTAVFVGTERVVRTPRLGHSFAELVKLTKRERVELQARPITLTLYPLVPDAVNVTFMTGANAARACRESSAAFKTASDRQARVRAVAGQLGFVLA